MIDIKELRIGNWIMTKHPANKNRNEIITKWQVYASDFEQINESPVPEVYYPIKITSQILKSIGFENKRKSGQLIISDNTSIQIILGPPAETSIEHWGESIEVKPTEYLHQLQNLYFALTGKELEITLQPTSTT